MPIYIYTNEDETDFAEILQGMNDVHEYVGPDGKPWRRVFTVPQGATNTKIDPFSRNAFVDKLGSSKGSIGDAWERSAELSKQREAVLGKDPIKEKYYEDYAKNHRGKRNQTELKEKRPDTIYI